MAADPGHIVICAGFAHGLAVTCAALREAGAATLAVEAYGHQAHRDLAQAQGLTLRPLPVDACPGLTPSGSSSAGPPGTAWPCRDWKASGRPARAQAGPAW